MRSGGINWLAVIVAAVAIYAVGFVIFGLLVPPDTWVGWEGDTAEEIAKVGDSRMPFGVIMPLLTAIFMAVIFKWAQVAGASNGAKWGAIIALASAVPATMYGWVWRWSGRSDDGGRRSLASRPCRCRSDIGRLEVGS